MGYIMTGIAPRKKRQIRSHTSQSRLNKRLKSQSLSLYPQSQELRLSNSAENVHDTRSILERFPLEILHKIFILVGVQGNNMYYMSHYFKICLKPTLKLKLDVIQESFISDLNERVRAPTLENRIHRLLRVYEFDHQKLQELCQQICLNPNYDEENPSRVAAFREAMAFASHLRKWRYAVDSSCLQYKFVSGDVISHMAKKYGYIASKENIAKEAEWRELKAEKLVIEVAEKLGEPATSSLLDEHAEEEESGDEYDEYPLQDCEHLLFVHQFRSGYFPLRFFKIDTEEKLAQCEQLINMGVRFQNLEDPLQYSLHKQLQVPLLQMAKTVHANCENKAILVYSILNGLELYKDGYQGTELFQHLLKWYCSDTDGVKSKHELDMVWGSLMDVRNVELTELFMNAAGRKLGLHYGAL